MTTPVVPNTLVNGNNADADEVQGNFDYVTDWLTAEAITINGGDFAILPTSSVTPSVGTQLTTKTYVDQANTTGNAATATLATTATTAVTATTATTAVTTSGNAATATSAAALTTPRAINGVNFDGSAPITVTADANTLSNTTLKSTVVASSLTSVGTLSALDVNGTIDGTNINASGQFTGDITAGTGTAAAPSVRAGDSNSGMWGGNSILRWSIDGVERMDLEYNILSIPALTLDGPWQAVTGYETLRRRTTDGYVGYAGSSLRYKDNVVDADETWRSVYNLRPVDFDWNNEIHSDDQGDRADYGLIAEETAITMPSVVEYRVIEGQGDLPVPDSVQYEKLSVYLIPLVQDLNARLEALEAL
jgi:hypothetical protein